MHRSSALARIVTTLVTLLAVPVALLALSAGGVPWMQVVMRRMPLITGSRSSVYLSAGRAIPRRIVQCAGQRVPGCRG